MYYLYGFKTNNRNCTTFCEFDKLDEMLIMAVTWQLQGYQLQMIKGSQFLPKQEDMEKAVQAKKTIEKRSIDMKYKGIIGDMKGEHFWMDEMMNDANLI
jgi:hypothetical protein